MEKKSYRKDNDSLPENSSGGTSRFMKDKRPCIRKPEQIERRRTDSSEAGNSGEGSVKRRSFNPNFDGSNKLRRPRNNGDTGTDENRRKFNGKRPYGKQQNRKFGNNRKQERYPEGGYDSDYKPTRYPTYHTEQLKEPIRLNKFISMSGVCSRREADDLIQKGEIMINGVIVKELGTKINPGDKVCHNDKPLQGEKKVYIIMNKPKGFVTTVEDSHAERTVMDLVKNACSERVYPVGRLDKNSLGVLIITNDGELTKKLTHPSNQKKKIYQISLDRNISIEELQRLVDGVELEDGMAQADEVSYVGTSKKEIGIVVHSGRNRIVRRMFEALGYHVQKLDRVYFAGMTKKKLRRGAWRYLTPKEVAMLKSGVYE